MKNLLLILLVLFALSLPIKAADEQEDASQPDFLIPVDPYPPDYKVHYTNQVREKFNLGGDFAFQMLVWPSFDPEYVVRVTAINMDGASKASLTYSIADQNIWYSMPDHNDEHQQKKVKVTTQTVDFPVPLAQRLNKLWKRMLLRAHYPYDGGASAAGVDGTVFEFGAMGMYGEVWSPIKEQSPRLLANIGISLVDYCKAAPAKRAVVAKAIEENAAKLEGYLDKHPN